MGRCAVDICKNNLKSAKKPGANVIFHRFPKDPARRKEWYIKCKTKTELNMNTASICSEHFAEEDYERDLKAELLGLPPSRKLKLIAVPSLKLTMPNTNNTIEDSNKDVNAAARKRRCEARAIRKRALATLESISLKPETYDKGTSMDSEFTEAARKSTINLKTLTESSVHVQNLYKEIKWLKHQNTKLHRRLLIEKSANKSLREKCMKQKLSFVENKRKLRASVDAELRKVFSEKQIRFLHKKNKRIQWGEEDIKKALTVYKMSHKCYSHLLKDWNIPLPSVSTLKKWRSKRILCSKTEANNCQNVKEGEHQNVKTEETEYENVIVEDSVSVTIKDPKNVVEDFRNVNIKNCKNAMTEFYENSVIKDCNNIEEGNCEIIIEDSIDVVTENEEGFVTNNYDIVIHENHKNVKGHMNVITNTYQNVTTNWQNIKAENC